MVSTGTLHEHKILKPSCRLAHQKIGKFPVNEVSDQFFLDLKFDQKLMQYLRVSEKGQEGLFAQNFGDVYFAYNPKNCVEAKDRS